MSSKVLISTFGMNIAKYKNLFYTRNHLKIKILVQDIGGTGF